ncbi:hypothetical protein RvY_07521-2 [Ramazzottius varieornatus]|uniref:TGF-beta family profile domain-containing protein n=1 Tax=Ramazzottius varieornatus TaxID=947166 RepID=A0A1D1VAX2_RAMVA|nr:hypothetical protein RvY_07521-2 [Ramazzottius varieornatus]
MEWTKSLTAVVSLLVIALSFLPAAYPCKGCHMSNNGLDPRSAINMRIEQIKQKILSKLRMEKAPVITKPKRSLPKSLFHEMSMFNDPPASSPAVDNGSPDVEDPPGLEEFYARENQMAVFGDISRCVKKVHNQIACISFTLPTVVFKKDIQSAMLHLNIKRGSSIRQRLTLRDIRYDTVAEEDVVASMDSHKEGWLPVEIGKTVRQWTRRDAQTSFMLQISCETCNHHEAQKMLALDGDATPFILITTEGKRGSRNRRGLDCSASSVQCCRESLYINFTDIGWDSWILEPHGYMANFCKGQCGGNVQSPTLHHSAIQAPSVFADSSHGKRSSAMNHELGQASSCCAPTRMSAVSMLFYDGEGAVHRSVLPNMSVESCGCT